MSVVRWEWTEGDRRPGLPWIGIFLLVFGGLLLLQSVYPEFQRECRLALLRCRRGRVPRLVDPPTRNRLSLRRGDHHRPCVALGALVDGRHQWPRLSLGIAFLIIAVVRAAGQGGWGWQAWVGGILAILGMTQVAVPAFGELFWPLVLLTLGIVIIVASMRHRDRGW
jgi:hypothetical protein